MGFEALSAVRRPPIPPDPAPFVTPWTGHAEWRVQGRVHTGSSNTPRKGKQEKHYLPIYDLKYLKRLWELCQRRPMA